MKKFIVLLLIVILVVTSLFSLTACTPPEELRIIVNMQDEWKIVTNTSVEGYPQAGVILTPDMYNDANVVNDLYAKLSENDEYILNNPDEVDALLTAKGSILASSTVLTRDVIARCNTNTLRASDVYERLCSYYTAMDTPIPDSSMVNLPVTSSTASTDPINIYVPDGAPALAMASLMKEGATVGGRQVNVTISTGGVVKTALLTGQADIVILPTTACANLFNQGKDIKLHSVTTWGVLYLIGQEATSFSDLIGEVVYSIGRDDTPGKLLRKYLEHYDIQYVESQTPVEGKVAITYVEDASYVITNLKAGSVKFALLGEPAVSNVLGIRAKNNENQ